MDRGDAETRRTEKMFLQEFEIQFRLIGFLNVTVNFFLRVSASPR